MRGQWADVPSSTSAKRCCSESCSWKERTARICKRPRCSAPGRNVLGGSLCLLGVSPELRASLWDAAAGGDVQPCAEIPLTPCMRRLWAFSAALTTAKQRGEPLGPRLVSPGAECLSANSHPQAHVTAPPLHAHPPLLQSISRFCSLITSPKFHPGRFIPLLPNARPAFPTGEPSWERSALSHTSHPTQHEQSAQHPNTATPRDAVPPSQPRSLHGCELPSPPQAQHPSCTSQPCARSTLCSLLGAKSHCLPPPRAGVVPALPHPSLPPQGRFAIHSQLPAGTHTAPTGPPPAARSLPALPPAPAFPQPANYRDNPAKSPAQAAA